jgi:hypothetical protein
MMIGIVFEVYDDWYCLWSIWWLVLFMKYMIGIVYEVYESQSSYTSKIITIIIYFINNPNHHILHKQSQSSYTLKIIPIIIYFINNPNHHILHKQSWSIWWLVLFMKYMIGIVYEVYDDWDCLWSIWWLGLFLMYVIIGIVYEVYDDCDYLWSIWWLGLFIKQSQSLYTSKTIPIIIYSKNNHNHHILHKQSQSSYTSKFLMYMMIGLFLMYMMIGIAFNVYDDWDCF